MFKYNSSDKVTIKSWQIHLLYLKQFLQHFESAASIYQLNVYQGKNTVIKGYKIQLIIMDIIQSHYTLSNRNNGCQCFCSTLLYHAWWISFLWFLIKTNYSTKSKWWNYQFFLSGHCSIGWKLYLFENQ